MRARWLAATWLSLLFVLGCTLYPFQFSLDDMPGERLSNALFIEIGPDRGLDVLTNVLLFLPFGIALAGYLEHKRVSRRHAIVSVLVTSACVSYVMEVLQQLIPGRFSSLTDVASNTFGGVVGAIYYGLWQMGRTTSHSAAPTVRTEEDVRADAAGAGSPRGSKQPPFHRKELP